MSQITYEYNLEYQTIVQLRSGTPVYSMYVPEEDIGKLRMLLWSIDMDNIIENSNEANVETDV